MRRGIAKKAVAAALAVACLFSGCALPSTELENRAIVSAVGVDFNEGDYTVTIAYYALNAAGDEAGSPVGEQTTSSSAVLHQAFSGAEAAAGGGLFWGHASYLVIGESAVTGEKLDDILEYAASGGLLGADIGVCVARGSAGETVAARVQEQGGVAKALDQILHNQDTPTTGYVRLFEIARDLRKGGCGGYLPLVETDTILSKPQGETVQQTEQTLSFTDLVLLHEGRVSGYVGEQRIPLFLAAFSRCRSIEVRCPSPEGEVFAAVEHPGVSFSFGEQGKVRLTMTGQLVVSCVVRDGNVRPSYDYADVKAAVEEYAARQLENLFFAVSGATGNDVFELRLRHELRFGARRTDAVFGESIDLSPQATAHLRAVA